jgi:hypothetical protein
VIVDKGESLHPAVMRPSRDRTELLMIAALVVVTLLSAVATGVSIQSILT